MPGVSFPGGAAPGVGGFASAVAPSPEEKPGGATTAEVRGTSPEPRVIDPGECWVRHVVRGEGGEPSAKLIGPAYFVREDVAQGEDGLNGRQGWQQAETTAVLQDDGSFTAVFPNAAGDDGILHRRRFQILTNTDYEPGEEWLEFYRDPNDVIFVGTPTDYEKTKSTVTIKGADLNAVLAGCYSTEVDLWDAAAPADVFEHYSRVAVLAFGEDLEETLTGGVGAWSTAHSQALAGVSTDCWTCEARLRWVSARPSKEGEGKVRLKVAGLTLTVDVYEGATTLEGGPTTISAKQQGLVVPGPVDLRIVAFYDHIFAFVAGELVAEVRRLPAWPAVGEAKIEAFGGSAALDGLQVTTLADFAARGAVEIERMLPGIPPGTGLRGQYWNAAPIYAQLTERDPRLSRLWALTGDEPAVDRVDPQVNFPSGTAGYPPNLPGAYAARWSGAIYLDLASGDRNLRLKGLVGNVRVYVGKTRRDEPLVSSWSEASKATLTSGSLREWLGSEEAGWWPIVIEQAHSEAKAGMLLEDRQGSGAYELLPQSRLSPVGVYSDLVRLTSHRQVYGDVAQTFGYQWRVEHRSLETDEFPGQLSFKALIGRQTNVVIDDESMGTEAQVQGAAGDVVDGLLADAAGLADPKGSGQLTAQSIDYVRAREHMALRQSYESLSDITDPVLLQTRIDSLLILRSSPNEQVGVRPRGQRDIVDSFPLTGELARMDWQPGDGLTLRLESIDVKDESPRQLTTVSWPLKPDGIGAPTVGFRQRPRTPRAALKRLSAAIFSPRRTYQGNVAIIPATIGGANPAGEPFGGANDGYSRAAPPTNLSRIVKAIAVVSSVEGNGWRLEVNGVDLSTSGAVPSFGRYDVTRALKASAGGPYSYVRLIGGASGGYLVTLEILVTI